MESHTVRHLRLYENSIRLTMTNFSQKHEGTTVALKLPNPSGGRQGMKQARMIWRRMKQVKHSNLFESSRVSAVVSPRPWHVTLGRTLTLKFSQLSEIKYFMAGLLNFIGI